MVVCLKARTDCFFGISGLVSFWERVPKRIYAIFTLAVYDPELAVETRALLMRESQSHRRGIFVGCAQETSHILHRIAMENHKALLRRNPRLFTRPARAWPPTASSCTYTKETFSLRERSLHLIRFFRLLFSVGGLRTNSPALQDPDDIEEHGFGGVERAEKLLPGKVEFLVD